jgi:hypothetical protein
MVVAITDSMTGIGLGQCDQSLRTYAGIVITAKLANLLSMEPHKKTNISKTALMIKEIAVGTLFAGVSEPEEHNHEKGQ